MTLHLAPSRRARRAALAITLTALAVLVLVPVTRAQSGYRVIVNAANQATEISREEVSRLLLKKQTSWDDGTVAEPVDLDGKSDVRDAFSREVHGRSVSSIKNYWQRQIFSGRAVPPPELGSDAEVVGFVAGHPGGIGYVADGTALGRNVKEVRLVD